MSAWSGGLQFGEDTINVIDQPSKIGTMLGQKISFRIGQSFHFCAATYLGPNIVSTDVEESILREFFPQDGESIELIAVKNSYDTSKP